jgi:hypothetical protein
MPILLLAALANQGGVEQRGLRFGPTPKPQGVSYVRRGDLYIRNIIPALERHYLAGVPGLSGPGLC